MLFAFLTGLSGSLGHCVGMCSGITLLLTRRGIDGGWSVFLLHLGRLTTYALLGLIVGSISALASPMILDPHIHYQAGTADLSTMLLTPPIRALQGGVAIFAALVMFYFAIAFTGWLPSLETLFGGLTSRWGKIFRRFATVENKHSPLVIAYPLGLLWGLLPCGLVLTALFIAATAASPLHSALLMLAFGLGTWPALLIMSWLSRQRSFTPRPWIRYAAAGLVILFGVQLLLRGMALWGVVEHVAIGEIMLW